MINFPDSPTANQVFTTGGASWLWDSVKWVATSGLVVPVVIAQGGTSATTASQARANLGAAGLNSPAFTGDPQAPTPVTSDNDTSIATTAYVKAQGYAVGSNYLPLAGGTLTGALVPAQVAGIVGTTAANNAAAGAIGEYISSVVPSPGVGVPGSTWSGVAAISLSAGDWDLSGDLFLDLAGTATQLYGAISNVSPIGSPANSFSQAGFTVNAIAGPQVLALPPARFILNGPLTVNLWAYVNLSTGTCNAYGKISARRVR